REDDNLHTICPRPLRSLKRGELNRNAFKSSKCTIWLRQGGLPAPCCFGVLLRRYRARAGPICHGSFLRRSRSVRRSPIIEISFLAIWTEVRFWKPAPPWRCLAYPQASRLGQGRGHSRVGLMSPILDDFQRSALGVAWPWAIGHRPARRRADRAQAA